MTTEQNEIPQIQTFEDRMITMMDDYNITLFDALLWEFEAYYVNAAQIFWAGGFDVLEETFLQFLEQNDVATSKHKFYADIFMGRSNNMGLSNG